jgi:hypothetical protein
MEKNISIIFSKLSPVQDKENYSIELINNNKTIIIPYPQNTPLILSLSQKTEKQILSIIIKSKQISKKQKIIGYGDINIYKKFLTEKPLEKYILLFKEKKDKNKIKLNNNSIGKIFVQIKLDELSNNKTQIKDINENIFHKNIENEIKKEINDDNIKMEQKNIKNDDILLNENEITLFNNIDDFLSFKNIIKLKEIIENGENSFLKDINSLKSFNQNLFNRCKEQNEKFSKIFLSLSERNQNLEKKIEEITHKNKIIEEEINQLELDSNKNDEELKQKIKEIKEKRDITSKNIESLKSKEKNNDSELNLENNSKANNNKISDINDIIDICKLIKIFNSLGYNIQDGDLTDSEKQNLSDLLKNLEKEKNKNIINNKEILDENELNQIKDDYELGDAIITLIERDVNDLFSRKLIELVNIDQVDSITYIFSGKSKKKEINFKLENNNFICSTGETFAVWLIKNFSI